MSLQVWLPLNGNLNNQGLSGNIITSTHYTENANGKIGKCIKTTATGQIGLGYSSKQCNTGSLSFCGWFKINKADIWATISSLNYTSTNGTVCCNIIGNNHYGGIGLWLNSNNIYNDGTLTKLSVSSYIRTSTAGAVVTSQYTLPFDTWVHIGLVYNKTENKHYLYINGALYTSKTIATFSDMVDREIAINYAGIAGGNGFGRNIPMLVNDVRLYDHALSEKEIQEIAKGLVVHYKLDNNGLGGENLFIGSAYTSSDITNFVGIGNTDWTKPLRYYNGSENIHSFANGIDTITLTSTSNLGIAFVRSAADINLDTNSQYTISCEAQCSSISKPFCIGLSYYTTANTWTWRGGTNGQNFKAIDTWQKFTLTFTPDANTQYIGYCFTVATGGNNILKIRNCKLEKGSIATSWSPAPEEVGTNNTIYDCSGYQNNATPIGILTASTDTAKYSVATKFINTSYIRSLGRPNNFLPHDAITVNLWMKCTTWGNPISCTEDGGFNFEYAGGGIRFPIHITHSSGNSYALAQSTITPNTLLNDWHMLTGTFDGTNTIMYIDGEEVGRTAAYSGTIHYYNNYLFIGAEAQGDNITPYSSTFVGNISDVRIYATALSAAAIKDLYETSAEIDKNGNFYAREVIEL